MLIPIVKSELYYHRTLFLTVYGISLPFIISNLIITHFTNTAAGVMFVMLPVMGIVVNRHKNEHLKIRYMTTLPVPTYLFAFTRHIVWLAFWIPAQCLLLISCMIGVNNDPAHPLVVLLFMNSVILLVGMASLFSDLRYAMHHVAMQRLFKFVSTFCIVLAAPLYFQIVFSQALGGIVEGMAATPQSSLLLGILAICVMGLGYFSFSLRKSYLTT